MPIDSIISNFTESEAQVYWDSALTQEQINGLAAGSVSLLVVLASVLSTVVVMCLSALCCFGLLYKFKVKQTIKRVKKFNDKVQDDLEDADYLPKLQHQHSESNDPKSEVKLLPPPIFVNPEGGEEDALQHHRKILQGKSQIEKMRLLKDIQN